MCDTTYYEHQEINEQGPTQYSWPLIVSIRFDCQEKGDSNTHCCSGTILTKLYILTTADCVDNLSSDISLVDMTIVTNKHSGSESEQIIRKIDHIIIHSNWTPDRNNLKHNIALLHLSSPLDSTLDQYITPICCSTDLNLLEDVLKYPSNNTRLFAIQWDSPEQILDTTTSANIKQTEMLLVDNNDATCTEWVYNVNLQFCARLHHDSNGSCNYKSEGPIFQWIDNGWMQVGILSFVAAKTNDSCMGIYTRLAYYHEWIKSALTSKSLSSFTTTTTTDSITNRAITYECDVYTVPCGCSAENVELSLTKIIGGEEVIPYSWTMTVSIRLNDSLEHSCGGSILTNDYILTSARCVDGVSMMEMSVAAGFHNRVEDLPTIRYVHDIYIHPNWNGSDGTYRNDIALLRIFPPLPVGGYGFITRTCVPYFSSVNEIVNYPLNGSHLIITGWGSTQYGNSNMSDTLQQASIYVIDNNDPICQQSIHDVNTQFCAGIQGGDPCQDDLGDPIYQWKGTYWEQVGITSYGGRCDQIGSPSVFTRLVYYFEWIESVINSSLTTTSPPPPASYVCNKTASCGCGKVDVTLTPSRIVGGENALKNSWPMIVSLRLEGTADHSCGGTIVSNSYILTAAHCFRRISIENPTGITIAAGMTNRSDPLQIIRNVDRIYIHPNYTNMPGDYRHDIALLHIDQPFIFEPNSNLTKTCIHRIDPPILANQYPTSGTRLAVIGWGVRRPRMFYLPEILQQVEVMTIDNEESICSNFINNNNDLHFCAGLLGGGKDSCQGDSGGPIFQWTGKYWEQVGIVSHGRGCALADSPGIYTRLSYYYHWIEEVLKRDGEHLEPDFLSYLTTTRHSSTRTSQIPLNTTTSFWSPSTSTNTTMLNSTYKYTLNVLIFGPFILLLLLYYK